ncbi:hypothetical protein KVR01_010804 [Diaporthe batatas]|uniref:uncharacterized protein n=1 Tax=Diaporthe batatas TaxID=748121 RepID=UPI001D05BA38|nr:uncharacterized protein KVR01_010804 [Diaporthe batatas]KAG8159143.1 hypothetical protein KVR01_010804 [Diaporthe batatas]
MDPAAPASHGCEPASQDYIATGCLVCKKIDLEDTIRPYSKLLDYRWCRFETIDSRDDHNVAIVRVHVLPDDSFNSLVPRDDPILRGKKKTLLASLDYSSSSWRGWPKRGAPLSLPRGSPQIEPSQGFSHHDGSLLAIFNSIPSPRPDFALIQDHITKEAMTNLLSGTVRGLKTELYPYQCRSAAMMVQKEEYPGEIMDPRLVQVPDQHGTSWYYDANTGEARRGPRRYDRICGGILAEEMGSGKTLISLALIAATRDQPAVIPEIFRGGNLIVRPTVGSLMDMAASVATKSGVSWKRYIDSRYQNCIRAIERNPGWYPLPRPRGARTSRRTGAEISLPPTRVFVSHASLIVVPPNLLTQWMQEIAKHTNGLMVLEIASKKKKGAVSNSIPCIDDLIHCDIAICTVTRLETIWSNHKRLEADGSYSLNCSLGQVQFKRCIVDEGHKLGNIRLSSVRTDLLQALEALHVNARWIVTGTPAKGLFGMQKSSDSNTSLAKSSTKQESEDLRRIGSIATFYLKARPWSNTTQSHRDTLADWKTYMVQGRKDCLASTFNSLIIRHQLSEISDMLPAVDSKVVKLEGSYQDKLCMNLFSMMIIFNAVQSQRTDQDYFFHPRNRKAMLELVNNLRQAIFFGGSFFSESEIQKSVETAESFLQEKPFPIDEIDEALLKASISLGKTAVGNRIKRAANVFHEMPIYVDRFPGGCSTAWSVDEETGNGPLCTNWKLVIAAQRTLRPFLGSTAVLNTYLNSGSFCTEGLSARGRAIHDAQPPQSRSVGRNAEKNLAGNTKLGEGHFNPRRAHLAGIKLDGKGILTPPQTPQEDIEIAEPLAVTQLISTVSAKLSYLIDEIASHQKEEQMIVFYDNDNIAWYLAGVLEMLQICHLIYSKGISVDRRARYVSTFTHSSKFRVLLMDIAEAAFGLDMKSASRIYFISPVLDPQVEIQAIGRVRRISQRKRVTVETLVLKDSIEELIIERKMKMTQAEHRRCKTVLDDRPIYNWILNARIVPLPDVSNDDGPAQMAPLAIRQYVFGREFGREVADPDEDILCGDPSHTAASLDKAKRKRPGKDKEPTTDESTTSSRESEGEPRSPIRPTKRARFAGAEDEVPGVSGRRVKAEGQSHSRTETALDTTRTALPQASCSSQRAGR